MQGTRSHITHVTQGLLLGQDRARKTSGKQTEKRQRSSQEGKEGSNQIKIKIGPSQTGQDFKEGPLSKVNITKSRP